MLLSRILLAAFLTSSVWAAADGLVLGLHLVTACNSPGASFAVPLPDGPSLCLERSAVVDQTDVVSAAREESTNIVRLNLTTAAAQRLREQTGTHVGSRMAVLVDGRIVAAPAIAAAVDQAAIPGLPREEAESIVAVFARGAQARAGVALPGPAANRVYRVGGNTSAPVPVRKAEPEYSPEARSAGIEGTVYLNVTIAEDGTVKDPKVTRGLRPDLDRKAIEAVGQWRFRPAMKSGRPVAVSAQIEMNFRL